MIRSTPPKIWDTYEYFDPRGVLIDLNGPVSDMLVRETSDDKVRRLRARPLLPIREHRQAALFCYGMSCFMNEAISYALVEDADFDCIARRVENSTANYTPIQLKELPPHAVNPRASLESELTKLKKYMGRLVVAYYINRRQRIDLNALKIPILNISALWLYGSISDDNSRWMLFGDLLNTPSNFEYKYPS